MAPRRLSSLAWAILLFLCLPAHLPAMPPPRDSAALFRAWLADAEINFGSLRIEHAERCAPLLFRLRQLDVALSGPAALNAATGYPLLLEKIRLDEQLRRLRGEAELKILRLRFRKSIEMLKMLYEKILGMDHHFTSLRTSQQVMKISNPHEYPEFKEMKTLLQDRMKKKNGFTWPALLDSNPYLSAAFSLIGLALGGNDTKLSRQQLDHIACILDFTVRMHQDLGVIYYETEYLRDGNLTLKKECENLFADCARQVGYTIPLTVCRESDDWERLYAALDQYVEKAAGASPFDPTLSQKANINLQFSIDRVVHFIEKYCAFVAQGNEYYKKFSKIVNNYANETTCSGTLPDTFTQLKADIGITLEKFNSAYNLPEIQGSRLKDLLYGAGE